LLLTERHPAVVQVTTSGIVSSILPVYPVMVGESGLAEIICIWCY